MRLSVNGGEVFTSPLSSEGHGRLGSAVLAAFADGPVSDTPEPVTPQAVVSGADSDGDDGDTVPHV